MKNKILIITIIILFIGLLIGIKLMVEKNEKSYLNNEKNEENITNSSEEKYEAKVIEIKENEFEEKVLKSDKKVVVDFYATWCAPCRKFSPIVEEVAKEKEDIVFYKINIDNATNISDKYNVISIPTLLVIENGKEINRSVGLISKDKIIEMIEK